MGTNKAVVHQALYYATEALKHGDKQAARHWAQRAARLTQDRVEPWLILAEISSPRARKAYLGQALKINPDNPAVLNALHALRREIRQQTKEVTQPIRIKQPHSGIGVVFLVGIFEMIAVLAVTLFFFSAYPQAITRVNAIISQNTALLSYIPQNTTTTRVAPVTPTATPSAMPETAGPTLTATLLPSATPTVEPSPVQPSPTAIIYTVRKGDILVKIASQYGCDVNELVELNGISNPSYIKTGQTLLIPVSEVTNIIEQNEAAAVPASSQSADQSIVVDISEQHVYAYEGDKLVFSFVASTGSGNSTLVGEFSILDKIANAYSDPWGFWMPYWMGIYWVGSNLENGFHSLPVLADGTELWGDQIGTPVTYGCVVLSPGDMKQLYEWVEIGTPVKIIR